MSYNKAWRQKLSRLLKELDSRHRPQDRCRLIVELSNGKTDRVASILSANHCRINREIRIIPSLVVEAPFFSLEELARARHVRRIWYDSPAYALLDVAVPTVGGSYAQELGLTGKDIVVAVLDTGIHPHPDLTVPTNRILSWNDLVNEKPDPYDDNGHGTHVAGIIAGNGTASRGEYKGMAPEAKLVGVKVLNGTGTGSTSTVISGIEWCINNQSSLHIRAINLSLGTTAQESCHLDPMCRAATAAWKRGMVVCAAAGNEGPKPKTINSPGINSRIITVGNLDDRQTINWRDDRLNQSSSRGPTPDDIAKPDLVAPGTRITASGVHRVYTTMTGSSMATPMVTGAVAQILQKQPSLTPDEIKQLLIRNARDMGLGPNLQGAGVLNMKGVLDSFERSRSYRKNFLKGLLFGGGDSDFNIKAKNGKIPNTDFINRTNPYTIFLILILLILSF